MMLEIALSLDFFIERHSINNTKEHTAPVIMLAPSMEGKRPCFRNVVLIRIQDDGQNKEPQLHRVTFE
jgi:hypothetical protein